MSKPDIKVSEGLCDICDETNSEVAQVIIEKKWFFCIWVNKINICQGCVSRLFRSFNSDK